MSAGDFFEEGKRFFVDKSSRISATTARRSPYHQRQREITKTIANISTRFI